ncbi:MAG: hypothetical protein OXC09_08455 [Truepera sp.]|nr:hypothetical protein [Truepera sp.]
MSAARTLPSLSSSAGQPPQLAAALALYAVARERGSVVIGVSGGRLQPAAKFGNSSSPRLPLRPG